MKVYVWPETKFEIDAEEGEIQVAGVIAIVGVDTELTVMVVVVVHPLEFV